MILCVLFSMLQFMKGNMGKETISSGSCVSFTKHSVYRFKALGLVVVRFEIKAWISFAAMVEANTPKPDSANFTA